MFSRSHGMNLLFLDTGSLPYDVSTPRDSPLGGSQSAVCYLASELARRGHRVVVANRVTQDREAMGVRCMPWHDVVDGRLLTEPWDAFLVLNGVADVALRLRPYLHPSTPAVLWTQHAPNQPAMADLERAEVRDAWDAIVFVSEWQRAAYVEQFGIAWPPTFVLRNAIAPVFEGMFRSPEDLVRAKPSHPVLAYTSTPYRGLELLIDTFPAIRAEYPDAELQVYSSMRVSQEDDQEEEFASLYDRCRSTPGVAYRGSLAQGELSSALRGLSILSYPSTFAETSCIAVMEAMAAGACIVTSDLGALAETTMGFARLAPVTKSMDVKQFGSIYFEHLRVILAERRRDPAAFAAARWEQVQAVNGSCTWRQRAEQWERAIPGWRRSASA